MVQVERLFNYCLAETKIPKGWFNAIVILIFKKGNKYKLKNYRPISLLSVLYKLFTRIITQRLTNKLDTYQPREQAGFRRGYSTMDHLQTVKILIEKANEYNITLWMAMIDYEKAFDSIEIWAVINALSNGRIDDRYTNIIKYIYENATSQVMTTQEKTNKINKKRGVRQGDSISPKLFTLALEDMFKTQNWQNKGILIDGERLNHIRFADDITLIAENQSDLQIMIKELNEKSEQIGLKININKTKYLTNDVHQNQHIILNNRTIERVQSFIYLGQKIEITKNNLTADLARRISLGWSAFGKMQDVFRSNLPNTMKSQVFDQYVLPVLTYGVETWALNKNIIHRLQVTQRAMERRILNIKLQDRVTNIEIRRRTRVKDVVERVCTLKWNWAGHIGRMTDNRWTRRVIEWRPWENKRSRGRPQTRWSDDIKRLAGHDWMRKACNRRDWQKLREAFTRRWME